MKLIVLVIGLLAVLLRAAFGQGGAQPPPAWAERVNAQQSPTSFSVVAPEDIEKLWQVAIERGERPSSEGQLFLAFQLGRFRQYVTLTLTQDLFGSLVAIERIDFIQEQWQVTALNQDEIDQWLVSASADGTVREAWHKRLLEDRGTVLKEEFLSTDEDRTKAIAEKIAARFLPASPIVRQRLTRARMRSHLPITIAGPVQCGRTRL